MLVTKIISGGQTGVDTIGLQVAKNLGIETGGTAPRGFLREKGIDNEDISSYGLVEISDEEQADYTRRKGKSDPYTGRTELNVRNSDGTVYFSTKNDSAGLFATKRSARDWNKPFIENPTAEQLRQWIIDNNIKTLNVAGNRGSKLPLNNNISEILKDALSSTSFNTSRVTFYNSKAKKNNNKSDLSVVCYIPVRGIDDIIASKVNGWTPNRVATLRGMYDTNNPNNPLDTSNLEDATEKLIAYRKRIAISNAKAVNTVSSNLASAYEKMLDTFSAEDRFNRVNMISYLFSARLDAIQEANPNLSRKIICNGFKVNGQIKGGQTMVFEGVYNDILDYYAEAIEENDQESAESYRQVLENWPALVAFARMRLRDTEELKLGNKLEYADDANPDNYGDNNLSQLFEAESSKREGWQETSDFQSSFGLVGKQVRRLLGTIQKIENGEEVYDDLGFPIFIDPVKAHQSLIDTLRGVSSESKMMDMLNKASKTQEWLTPVIEALEENDTIKTQMFVDMKKAFQPYSSLLEKFENGVKKYETFLMNKVKNLLANSYMTQISLNRVINRGNSVYDSNGNINWRNLQKTRELVQKWLVAPKVEGVVKGVLVNGQIPIKNYKELKANNVSQKQILNQITQSLGIDIDSQTLDRIISNPRDFTTLITNLRDSFTHGFDKVLNKETITKMGEGKFSEIADKKYIHLYKEKYAASTAKEGAIREKIEKALAIVTKNREGLKLESRVRHKDSKGNGVTLFSNVLPSYLSDFMDRIGGYVKERDTDGLRKFIEAKFLTSSYFYDKENGVILNKWLDELYHSDLSKDDSFAEKFTWERFLGTPDESFENFTSKKHAIAMLSSFFSDKQISSKSEYAHYPVFVLGDSGVSKNIRAKRYSAQVILDGMYNVYKQECRRIALTKAANLKLANDGYSTIANFSSKGDQFTLLPFLNDIFKGRDIASISEKEVKDAIKEYMKEEFKSFKSKLQRLGVLDTITRKVNNEDVTIYEHLHQEASNEEELDKKLADFYWNTKFATIQQLQLMTIDPAFYKDTKDLQKRYKEIHAPGKVLSLEAIDANGNLYSEDGIERCIYFEDIEISASEKFLNSIRAHFGEDSRYEKYLKNTLTDGQGYRTLDSYRKVKGMAGEWSPEMENAYNEIKNLRSKYGKDDEISPEDLKLIADLSVIFQPIKPYMYTLENYPINDNDVLKIPVQHKYAEVVIIPELLPKGNQLRDLAYWMEENVDSEGNPAPIDLVGSTTIVKVGGFGTTKINNLEQYDNEILSKRQKSGNTDTEISNRERFSYALSKAYVHQLDYSDYRIQTNVPEHINSSQLFGTQVRKLIMSRIKADDYHYEIYVDGNKVNLGGHLGTTRLNGRNLVSFYNSLVVANILESYDEFKSNVEDIESLSDMLLQSTISNSRESMDNMLAYALDEQGRFAMPLFEGGLEHDSAAMLFSMFKKSVNKQSIKGGSAVQVSAMGISGYSESGDLEYVTDPNNPNNILYAECEIPFDLSYTDANGKEHALDFNDWCYPDGTIKTDSNGEPLIEKVYPNILSILAYRIPTERDYSMINLRVKRFSQKTAGGIIKVPVQGTTISGFDFDIDKLYFMRYEFKAKPYSKETIERIWKDFYADNPDIKKALSKVKSTEAGIQTLMESILAGFTEKGNDTAQTIIDTDGSKDRLYKYWKEAGLEGTPQEAISDYIAKNASKYGTEFHSYDYSKSPLENDRATRNNMLIQLIQRRLMDEETFEQRYTPGGFTNASKAARFLRELLFGDLSGITSGSSVNFKAVEERAKDKKSDPEPNYDPSDPMTIITYNQQNQVAGKLIGVFANQNTNHAFSSLMKAFYLKTPIAFGNHPEGLKDLLHKDNYEAVDLNVAEFLAASVDAVKDPVLNFLNLNSLTADAGALLARLGYSTREIGLLFNQPIIKEICENSFNSGTSISNSIVEIVERYRVNSEEKIPTPNAATELNSNVMASNIIKHRKATEAGKDPLEDQQFIISQLQFAELFMQILTVSNDVSKFVKTSKFTASNAVGSTFGDLYNQEDNVTNYLDRFINKDGKGNDLSVVMEVSDTFNTPINNNPTLHLENQNYIERSLDNPFAYEQAMYDMNRRVGKLLGKYYPYNTSLYKNARNAIASLLPKGISLDADLINDIHSDLLVYLLTQQEGSSFNGSDRVPYNPSTGTFNDGSFISSREYYTNHFGKVLYNHLENNPELKKLPIFQYMQFRVDNANGNVSFNVQDIGGLAPYQKDEIRESWADLLKESPDLARDLFLYNFYKLGFNFSPLTFMNLTPTRVKQQIQVGSVLNPATGKLEPRTYTDFLNDILNGTIMTNADMYDFAQQFIRNHTHYHKLVYSPRGSDLELVTKLAKNNMVFRNEFTLDLDLEKGEYSSWLIPADGKEKAFRPFIKIGDILYMADNSEYGGKPQFNISNSNSIKYRKVSILGEVNKSTQYLSTFSKPQSEITSTDYTKDKSLTDPNYIPPVKVDRTSMANTIIEEYTKAMIHSNRLITDTEIEGFRSHLSAVLNSSNDENLKETVELIKNSVKENGIMTLDENGQPILSC